MENKKIIDERAASWKLLLPHRPDDKILAIGVDSGVLKALARSWKWIDAFRFNERHAMFDNLELPINHLVGISTEASKHFLKYNMIIAGGGYAFSVLELHYLYCNYLAVDGVMVCSGYPYADIVKLNGLLKGNITVQRYGLLPHNWPRIIFPLANHLLRRKGLSFHQPGRMWAQLSVWLLLLFSRFEYTHLLSKGALVLLCNKRLEDSGSTLKAWLARRLGTQVQDLIIYCGSDVVQRKMTVLAVVPGQEDLVIKLADTESAKKAVRSESRAIRALAKNKTSQFRPPELILEDEWAGYLVQVQTALPKKRGWLIGKLTRNHIDALTELSRMDRRTLTLCETTWFASFKEAWVINKEEVPEVIKRIGRHLFSSTFQKRKFVCHRIHGDFAPWNIRVSRKDLFIWDWEDSVEDGLVYTDIFHFLVRQTVLLGPWPGAVKLLKGIRCACLKLQEQSGLPAEADHMTSLRIWLVIEYLRNPQQKVIELAEELEATNG